MARSNLTSASCALCWMLSPDALIMLGNSFGTSGLMFLVPFVIGAIISILVIILTNHPALAITNNSSFTQLATAAGLLPAMALTLASRLCLVLLLPTGMLVTAGFTFNETFIYWFPNFAFSFLLLGTILTLHLAGDRVARAAQPFFIGLTICSLVILCFAGLFGPQVLESTEIKPGSQFSLHIPLVFTSLLLFLGYDQPEPSPSSDSRRYYTLAVITGFIILTLWGFVSLKHVPQPKLANSTIPYIISAREILGQPGRTIIAIAIISGTCGVVNGLFLLANRSLQQIADHVYHPSVGNPALKKRIWPVIFSLFIGIFMVIGLAGSEKLDMYIYSALLFWLLMTGLQCFAAANGLAKQQKTSTRSWYLLSGVFPLAAVWLACINVHAATLATFCFLVLVTSTSLSAGWLWYDRKIHNKTNQNSQGEIS